PPFGRAALRAPAANTYDVRVGTSICESAARMSRNASTADRFGTKAARIRQILDGMCVNTIVFTSPIHFAIRAATRYENALRMLDQKKNMLQWKAIPQNVETATAPREIERRSRLQRHLH